MGGALEKGENLRNYAFYLMFYYETYMKKALFCVT